MVVICGRDAGRQPFLPSQWEDHDVTTSQNGETMPIPHNASCKFLKANNRGITEAWHLWSLERSLQCCKSNLLHFPPFAITMVTLGELRASSAYPHGHHMLSGQTVVLPKSRFASHWTRRTLNQLRVHVHVILFFHPCARESHGHTLLHMVLMNMLYNWSKKCQQHLAVWAAKLERSRRDSAWKPLLKSLYQSFNFFSSNWKEKGRVQRNSRISLNFVHDWFCSLAYITHLILPPSLVNHSPFLRHQPGELWWETNLITSESYRVWKVKRIITSLPRLNQFYLHSYLVLLLRYTHNIVPGGWGAR